MGKIRNQALEDAAKAAMLAEPLPDFLPTPGHKAAFRYGKDCAYAAIRELMAQKPAAGNRRAGGYARAASLSPERRAEIARIASRARWAKQRACKDEGMGA